MRTRNVAIIGLGKLGGRLCEEVVRTGWAGKLLLWNRSQRRLEGMMMSLQVYGTLVGSRTTVGILNPAELSADDVVVIALKDNYDPRDLLSDEKYPGWFTVDVRTVGFRRDLPLVRNVCSMLRNFDGIVLVVTNPLDIFTNLVKHWLPKATVLGLGVSLDAARLYTTLIGHQVQVMSWHDCPLGGEHGKHSVVIESLWKRNPQALGIKGKQLSRLLSQALQVGPRIVAGLGYTLHDCVLVFVDDIRWICEQGATRKWLHASFASSEGATGRPLCFDNSTCRILPFLGLATVEADLISKAGRRNARLVSRILGHPLFKEWCHVE